MTKGDKSTNIHCKMCFQRKRLPWYVAMEIIESSPGAVDLIGWSLTPEFHCTPSSSTYVEGNHPIWMKNGNNGNFYCLYCNIWSLISEHLLALLPCRWPLLSTSLGLHRSCCRSWRCPPLAETALSCLEQQSCIVPQLYWLPWVWILYKANNNLWLAHVNWWFIDTLWVRDKCWSLWMSGGLMRWWWKHNQEDILKERWRDECEEGLGKAAWMMQEHKQARSAVPDQKGAELWEEKLRPWGLRKEKL